MRPNRYIAAAVALSLLGQAALAFEETTVGGSETKAPAAPVLELPKDLPKALAKGAEDPAKTFSLTTPELQIAPGTEVRIPGLGTVGVLPKLDFGLELLYGVGEQKGPFQDKTNSDDVQLRGTIKHRF